MIKYKQNNQIVTQETLYVLIHIIFVLVLFWIENVSNNLIFATAIFPIMSCTYQCYAQGGGGGDTG